MKLNKHKKEKEQKRKKQEIPLMNKDKIVKFNLSYDNLKCFINQKYPKTDRKRASNKNCFNFTDSKKYREVQIDNQHVQVYHKIIRQLSPDPSREASNSIIERIQRKGLKCDWKQFQALKTQISESQEWQQQQILNQTFSQCSSSIGKNHSHASTVDFSGYYSLQVRGYSQNQLMNPTIISNCNQFISQTIMTTSEYFINDKNRYYETTVFQIDAKNIGNDPRTTLMIKNIPNKYTIQDLSAEINSVFGDTYDFLYLPCDSKNNCNVGYGFINFINTQYLMEFYKNFHSKKWIKFRSQKICCLTYARLQGLQSLIDHFQNSKVLNHKDKRYQPIIKDMRSYSKKIQNLIRQQKDEQSFV